MFSRPLRSSNLSALGSPGCSSVACEEWTYACTQDRDVSYQSIYVYPKQHDALIRAIKSTLDLRDLRDDFVVLGVRHEETKSFLHRWGLHPVLLEERRLGPQAHLDSNPICARECQMMTPRFARNAILFQRCAVKLSSVGPDLKRS